MVMNAIGFLDLYLISQYTISLNLKSLKLLSFNEEITIFISSTSVSPI